MGRDDAENGWPYNGGMSVGNSCWGYRGTLGGGVQAGPSPWTRPGRPYPAPHCLHRGGGSRAPSEHRETAHPLRAPAQAHTYFTGAGDRRAVDAQTTHAAGRGHRPTEGRREQQLHGWELRCRRAWERFPSCSARVSLLSGPMSCAGGRGGACMTPPCSVAWSWEDPRPLQLLGSPHLPLSPF